MARYIFGPVASRRLGRSLGIDLVERKCCSLDCVYCEAGATTRLSAEPCEFMPAGEVIAELDAVLRLHPQLDFVTFSGSGEPLLHPGFGEVVGFLKSRYPEYPVCLLTNAVGLGDPATARAAARVDLIVPSLDASSEREFVIINRPAPGVSFEGLVRGLTAFAEHYPACRMWLELFIVPGVNDSDASIARFSDIIGRVKPELVQLNSIDRPGAVDWVETPPVETVRRFIAAIERFAPVEAVGRYRYRTRRELPAGELDGRAVEAILALIARRPGTAADLAEALDTAPEALNQVLEKLLKSGLIQSEKRARGVFFSLPGEPGGA